MEFRQGEVQTSNPLGPPSVLVPGDGAELFPRPEVPEDPFRARRRMDLDQLNQAIRDVSGGIGWTEIRGNTEVDLFVELAATLGRPDYVEITDEDLSPSAMFQKFLDDAARHVCRQLIDRERGTVDPEARVFLTQVDPSALPSADPVATEANVRAQLLRFHGRRVPPGSPELEHWLWLLESAEHVGAAPTEIWESLCVGLMTHPGFFTY